MYIVHIPIVNRRIVEFNIHGELVRDVGHVRIVLLVDKFFLRFVVDGVVVEFCKLRQLQFGVGDNDVGKVSHRHTILGTLDFYRSGDGKYIVSL